MKSMKKLLSLVLALCLILGMATTAFAEEAEYIDLELVYDEAGINATAVFELGAGETKLYQAYINGDLVFTMNADDVTVVYKGKTYTPVEGVVTFDISGTRWEPSQFEITNGSEKAVTYTIEFSHPVGTQMNPEIVWDLTSLSASLEAGNDQGYYFTYYNRAATGTLSFSVTEATKDVEYDVILTNKVSSVQKTLKADGVNGVVSMDIVPYDEIIIQVAAVPDSTTWEIPALDITIAGEIGFPKGSNMNPDTLVLDKNTAAIEAGDADGYIYTWTADQDGELTIIMTGDGWSYSVSNLTAGTYGATRTSGDEPALIAQTIKVTKGDEIQIMVNTFDPADQWNNPAGDVTFTASTVSPAAKFTDLKEGKYYSDAMDFMVGNGFMNGTSETTMGHSTNTNRAMMATLLYRFAGQPSVEGLKNPFTDVPAGKYYTNAVIWAASEGIVKGTSDTTFGPTKELSRQDLVTMLWRYAGEPEADLEALEGFTDAGEVGNSRKAAVAWAIENEIITGMTDTTIGPKGNATRGQFATILYRYLQN